MAFDIHLDGSVAIVSPTGVLVGGDETRQLEVAFDQLIKDGNKRILVDLRGLDGLNEVAVRLLMQAQQRIRKQGGALSLCGHRFSDTKFFQRHFLEKLLMFDQYEEALRVLMRTPTDPPEG